MQGVVENNGGIDSSGLVVGFRGSRLDPDEELLCRERGKP